MKFHKFFLATSASAILAACGGGGSGDTFGPTGEKVLMTPDMASIDVGHSLPMRITGGLGPYQLVSSNPKVLPAPGKINNLHAADFTVTTGETFLTETVTMTVTDSTGQTAKSDITVKAVTMAVSPTALTLTGTQAQAFKIFGGRAPYVVTSSRPDLLTIDVKNLAPSKEFSIQAKEVATTVSDITLNISDASGTTVSAKIAITASNPVFKAIQVNPSGSGVDATTVGAIAAGQRGALQIEIDAGLSLPRTISLQRLGGDYTIDEAKITVGSNHIALATISVPTAATTQAAVLRITDDTSGKFIDHAFQIAGLKLSTAPESLTLQSNTAACITGEAGTVQIMGGVAPYSIHSASPTVVSATPATVPQRGGSTVLTAYGCTPDAGTSITVTDATGSKSVVKFINTATPPVAAPAP